MSPDRQGACGHAISPALADYGEPAFTDCSAVAVSDDSGSQEFQLHRASLTRMNLWG
jgi:hypothetical protein